MANIKSQIKRIKTNNKATERNKAIKAEFRTAVRKVREAVAGGDADKAAETLSEGVKTVVEQAKENEGVKRALLDPAKDPLGKGFHIIQGMIAIGSGGVFGKGFMAGTQTHLAFIPERTTDFIFAAYSEEFGLVGNLLLIAGFIFLIFRGLAIAMDAPTLFSRLLAGALTMMFFAYAFVNMGMVSGILPVVGVPLPFISYGGTAMVTLGLAVGMLMSIARAKRQA